MKELQLYEAYRDRNIVHLSPEATEFFEAEEKRLQALVGPSEAISDSFAAHVGKHIGMLARLTLTFHCITVAGSPNESPVDGDTVRLAARFMRKAFQHAYLLYGQMFGVGATLEIPRALARSILASSLSEFNRAKAIQSCRAFKTSDSEQQNRALQTLTDYGWIAPMQETSGYGARWRVNPQVHELFREEAEEARQRRAAVREAIKDEVAERKQ